MGSSVGNYHLVDKDDRVWHHGLLQTLKNEDGFIGRPVVDNIAKVVNLCPCIT